MSRQTTVIFAVVSGSGMVRLNGSQIQFNATVTVTDGDTISISKRGNKKFNVSLSNTGATYPIVLAGTNVLPSSGPYTFNYKTGNYTALVGSEGGGDVNFNIPTARFEDMITADVIDNATFFTYDNSELVSTNIRSPKVICFDSSTPIFKFILFYYDLTAQELRSLIWTYDTASGAYVYGAVTTIDTTGDLQAIPTLALSKSNYNLDVVKISSTKCFVLYYIKDFAPNVVNLKLMTCTISGTTVTPAASASLIASDVIFLGSTAPFYSRIKLLTTDEYLVLYSSGGLSFYSRIVFVDGVAPDGYTLSAVQLTSAGAKDIYGIQGFEIIDANNFVVTCTTDNVDLLGGVLAVKYSIAVHNPFSIIQGAAFSLFEDLTVIVGVGTYGQGDVIKLSTDKYVFYISTTSNGGPPLRQLSLASYDGTTFANLSSVGTSIETLAYASATSFLSYSYYSGDQRILKYDTSGDLLTTTTTLSVSLATIEENSICVFDTSNSRFQVSNIYDATSYAVLSGTITPLAKMTDFSAPFLVTQGGGPLVPTTPATTMTVGLLPSTTYYTHSQEGVVNDIMFGLPQFIDDQQGIIGSTDVTGTILTFV